MNGLISQLHLLGNAISFAEQNHRVISQNIANVNTPKYKSKELEFQQLLEAVDNASDGQPRVFDTHLVQGLQEREDGNNVDLDGEIADLKKNSMAYQTLVQVLGTKFGIMNRAING